jgi:isocitrate dehydrogenase kinase/phosphatase
VRAVNKIPVVEERRPVCDGNHPQLASYVQVMDEVLAQYTVVDQYNYILVFRIGSRTRHHVFYPDSYLDSLKAAQEQAVIAPLVRGLVGE